MNFFNSESTVTDIVAAVFVPEGQGNPIHKNRPSHGLALCINSSGSVYTFSDGKSYPCRSGECIFLPQGSSYTVKALDEKFNKWIHGYQSGVYAINFRIAEEHSYAPTVIKLKSAENILSEFIGAESAWRQKSTVYREECMISIYRIIRRIRLELGGRSNALAPALEYISAHYTDDSISLPLLSELCGISEQYFRRLLRAETGMSPAVYIRHMRMEYARSILDSGEYSVTDTAMLSGFNSSAYFSREFRKEYGEPPNEYVNRKRT